MWKYQVVTFTFLDKLRPNLVPKIYNIISPVTDSGQIMPPPPNLKTEAETVL
jgi:hypothetical protein